MMTLNGKRGAAAALVLMTTLVGACSEGAKDAQPKAAGQQPERQERQTNVTVLELTPQDLEERLILPGTLEAWEDLTLATELAGPVRWIGPAEGDVVSRGEEILRIDPDTQQANLDRAEAECELRRKKVERYRRLVAENLVSQQEYEDARNAFDAAQADLEICRLTLDKSTLVSPVDGVLDRLLVDRGEYVAPGTLAAVVVQVDRLKAQIDVPEKDVSFLAPGQRVRLHHAALEEGGEAVEGEIVHLSYKADPVTRTYRATIAVENREGRLRPGMIVRMEAQRRFHQGAIAVPLFALVEQQGEKVAYVEQDGIARRRKLVLGPVIGDQVVVREGLSAGERLIVKGQHLLSDGAAVAPVEH